VGYASRKFGDLVRPDLPLLLSREPVKFCDSPAIDRFLSGLLERAPLLPPLTLLLLTVQLPSLSGKLAHKPCSTKRFIRLSSGFSSPRQQFDVLD
jgi:hypothetical protein